MIPSVMEAYTACGVIISRKVRVGDLLTPPWWQTAQCCAYSAAPGISSRGPRSSRVAWNWSVESRVAVLSGSPAVSSDGAAGLPDGILGSGESGDGPQPLAHNNVRSERTGKAGLYIRGKLDLGKSASLIEGTRRDASPHPDPPGR